MSRKLKSIAGLLAAAGVTLGAATLSMPTAQADGAGASGFNDCPTSEVCAWQHPDYRGYMGHAEGNSKNWSNKIENKDSSWYNNGTGTGNTSVRIFTKHDYKGDWFCLDKGEYDNYDNDLSSNDRGSSHKWVDPSDC
ncbi:peptidase inhibitor family I36 protein [Streptomyces sp. MZ04]|uniref:peptidase inhibitor family I36 protein n=1 Tax=Streptomyces sp. MZ04 TaxID=2559236 RepID=UPI001432EA82|nr:peptidase inhibitor family I36 protein [Streptomyces sp. MZ04]